MRRYLLAAISLLGLSSSAFAADMALRGGYSPLPEAEPPVYLWSGLYAGINAGYGVSDFQGRGINLPAGSVLNSPGTDGTLRVRNGTANEDGFVGGGQVGYNWQHDAFVFGIEVDAQYKDFGRRNTDTGTYTFTGAPGAAFTPPLPRAGFRNSSSDFFGTVRGRVGYAFDRVLVFGTGGLAFDGEDTGWAAGGGLEYAFSQNLSAKVEALYVNLNQDRANAVYFPATNTLGLTDPHSGEFVVVRAGLNMRFDLF